MKKLITLLLVFSVLVSVFSVIPASAAAIDGTTYTEDFANADNVTPGTNVTVTGNKLNFANSSGQTYFPNRENTGTMKFEGIQAEQFEKAGKIIEYGYDVTVPYAENKGYTNANAYTDGACIKGFLVFGNPDNGNYLQFASRLPWVRVNAYAGTAGLDYENKVQIRSHILSDMNTIGAAAALTAYNGVSSVNDRIAADLTATRTFKISATVRYVPANDSTSAYYETKYFVDGEPLANETTGEILKVRVAPTDNALNKRKLYFWVEGYDKSGETTEKISIDNAYIKLKNPDKFEESFTGVTDVNTVAEASSLTGLAIKDNALEITSASGVRIPKDKAFAFNADDFENGDKYLEYGYKVYMPARENIDRFTVGADLRIMDKNNNAMQYLSKVPTITGGRNAGYTQNYSLAHNYTIDSSTTTALNFATLQMTGETADNKIVSYCGTEARWIDVKAVMKYVKIGNTGYYDTYQFADGKLICNADGTPAVLRVQEAKDMVNYKRYVQLYMSGSSTETATDKLKIDDIYIRQVDANKVDFSDIKIDVAGSGSASIAYLNTTGAAKTSDSLILAAYNDSDVLLGAKLVSGQAIAKDGAGKITAAFDEAVTGATKYRAFYWNSALTPVAGMAGPVNAATE